MNLIKINSSPFPMRVISYPFCDRSKSEFEPPGFANWAPRDIWRPSKSVYKFDNRTLLIVGCTALVLYFEIGHQAEDPRRGPAHRRQHRQAAAGGCRRSHGGPLSMRS